MNRVCFKGAINFLRGELGIKNAPNKNEHIIFIESNLWDFARKINCKKFAGATIWLTKPGNYNVGKYYKFPNVPNFKEALSATSKTFSNYDPGPDPTKEESAEFIKRVRKLIDKFSTKNPNKKDSIKMLKEKYKQGLIYSIRLREWIDKSIEGNVGGFFVYPDEKLKSSGILVKGIE